MVVIRQRYLAFYVLFFMPQLYFFFSCYISFFLPSILGLCDFCWVLLNSAVIAFLIIILSFYFFIHIFFFSYASFLWFVYL